MDEALRILAQMSAEHQLASKLIEAGGPAMALSVVLAWFMLKSEKKFDAITDAMRSVSHRLYGMQKTLLIDSMARDTCGPVAKRLAQEMLAEMEAQEKIVSDNR